MIPGPRRAISQEAFLARTRQLIARGEEIRSAPAWDAFRFWLLESDEFLESVWGRMDRYHLAWLNVGRDSQPPGSSLDTEGERRFIGEITEGKLSVLRTMLVSVERRGSTVFTPAVETPG